MTNITAIIDQESGIQYQGVEDRSSRTGAYPINGLIIGQFRRGRYDKPMTITNENIKAQLGYDPTNPYYMAVQDVLSSGVPSVQVLRAGSLKFVCTPTKEFKVRVLKTDFQENDVIRAAWRVTNENGEVSVGTDTYTLSDYYDPTLVNTFRNYGFNPFDLISQMWGVGDSISLYRETESYEPWQNSCVGGVSVIGGSLTGRGLTDFTSNEDMNVTLNVFINGVDRSFTVRHPFYTAIDGNTEHHKALMLKVGEQLNLLGFRTRLATGFLYQGPNGKYWGHRLNVYYDQGQFNTVSMGGNLIIGGGYTPKWDAVNFYETCEISKNGVNTPQDSYLTCYGGGEEDQAEDPYIPMPSTVEFLPCAVLGVALKAGEIDLIPTTDHPDGFSINGCGYYAGG